MKKYILMMLIACGAFAEDINFSMDESFIVEDKSIVKEDTTANNSLFDEVNQSTSIADVAGDLLKESVSLTGDFKTSGDYSKYDKVPTTGNVSGSIESNLNLDVRLKKGVKAYTSFNLRKANVDTSDNFVKLNEMFFDFNINDKVYIRSGKQNLAWGRGYFFNPTDLINIEKKKLDDVSGQREGNFGVKVHVPYGFSKNFYAYLQMEDKSEAKDLSLALKYEFLVKNSEFSVATILRNPDKYDPVIAADFSSSWGKAQTFGEFSLQKGDKISHYVNGVDEKLKDKLVLKGSLGYSRTFDRGAKENKKTLMLVQEVYYNGAGYTKEGKEGFPPITGITSPYYNPYIDGQYYLANFITMNKFLHKDVSLNLNALSNLSDNVHQVGGTLTYKLNEEVDLSTSLTGFLGEQGALENSIPKYTLGLSAAISF